VLSAAIPVNFAGIATFGTASLTVGNHSIVAEYSGDTHLMLPSRRRSACRSIRKRNAGDWPVIAVP